MINEKNPTAVRIGQRMKQARKMGGFDSGADLLSVIPSWGRGRLGNYETGVSIPSSDDILVFSQAVGASPCWVMFGIGPIKSDHRDIQATRHQNLMYCFTELKQQKKLTAYLKVIGLSRPKIESLIDNPFSSISDRLARRTEAFYKKPSGWMDEQHIENDPLCLSFPDDMREIMSIFSELKTDDRQKLLEIARVLSD